MAIIGRQAPADIVVPAPQVSSRHAEILAAGDGYYRLTDLGSSNGTFVNGARVQSAVITLSDRVSLGSQPFALQGFAHLLSAAAPRAAGAGRAVALPPVRPEATGVAWEKRAEVGFFRGFLDTTGAILNRPGAFFRSMPPAGGIGSPLLYTVVTAALASVFVAVYQRFGWLPGGMRYPAEWLIYVLPLTIVLTPLLGVLGVLFCSCLDQVSLLLLSGARRGFEATARVEGYAAGGTAFAYLLPFVGPLLAILVSLYLRIVGLSEAHQVGRGRATAAVFLPLVVLAALAVALLLTLVRQSAIPRGMFTIGF